MAIPNSGYTVFPIVYLPHMLRMDPLSSAKLRRISEMLHSVEERDEMVVLLLCLPGSRYDPLPAITYHAMPLTVSVLSGISGNLKQAREFFLQSTKLVKRKNNNLEKFCARRVSSIDFQSFIILSIQSDHNLFNFRAATINKERVLSWPWRCC